MTRYHNNELTMIGLDSDDDMRRWTPTRESTTKTTIEAGRSQATEHQSTQNMHTSSKPREGDAQKRKRNTESDKNAKIVKKLEIDELSTGDQGQGDANHHGGGTVVTTRGVSAIDSSQQYSFPSNDCFNWDFEGNSAQVNDTSTPYSFGSSLGFPIPSSVPNAEWCSNSANAGVDLTEGLQPGYAGFGNGFDPFDFDLTGYGATQDGFDVNSFGHIGANSGAQSSQVSFEAIVHGDDAATRSVSSSKEALIQLQGCESAKTEQVTVKTEMGTEDQHVSPTQIEDSEYEESDGEEARPSNRPKINKNGVPRKPRQPRLKLLKWDDNDWKNVTLGLVWACGELGIQIPFDQASQVVSESCTAGALQQAILKLRGKQIAEGYQIPALKMAWSRKTKHISPLSSANTRVSQDAAVPKGMVPKKKPTRMSSSQTLIITLKRAYQDADRYHLAAPHTAKASKERAELPPFTFGGEQFLPGLVLPTYDYNNNTINPGSNKAIRQREDPLTPTSSKHRRNQRTLSGSSEDLEDIKKALSFNAPVPSPTRGAAGFHLMSPFGLGALIETDETPEPAVQGRAGNSTMMTPQTMPAQTTSYMPVTPAQSASRMTSSPSTPPNSRAAQVELLGTLSSLSTMPQGNGMVELIDGDMIMDREDYDIGSEDAFNYRSAEFDPFLRQ